MVGYGEGVMVGAIVLRTVGVKMGFGVSVGGLRGDVAVGCGKAGLHDGMRSTLTAKTRDRILVLVSLFISHSRFAVF